MRTIDFSPLYRSVVGFDRLAGLLETAAADVFVLWRVSLDPDASVRLKNFRRFLYAFVIDEKAVRCIYTMRLCLQTSCWPQTIESVRQSITAERNSSRANRTFFDGTAA